MLNDAQEELVLAMAVGAKRYTGAVDTHPSVAGKRILVTGAGGSIGSELVLQIAQQNPETLLLADISEFGLYQIESAVRENFPHIDVHPYLLDVRSWSLVDLFFRQHPLDHVFHVAALKHVPLLQEPFNLMQAVRTNILGSANVADACASRGIQMVYVSTDKVVNPTSIMGMTKRVAEIVTRERFSMNPELLRQTRFGNVLGSSGSVVPLFLRQIARGGPVTVTHPEMRRYMMTIHQAVSLLLFSADHPQDKTSGLYVFDMGEQIKILDLAHQMIRQLGKEPGRDIEVQFIGVRPGEKLYEELLYTDEAFDCHPHQGVSRYDLAPVQGSEVEAAQWLKSAANDYDVDLAMRLMQQMVPQYTDPETTLP